MNVQEIIQQLNTLDMQNPGAWPGWVRTAAAVLLGVILVGAGGWFLVNPVYEQIQAERVTEQNLRADFEAKQKKVAALDAYRAQLAEMEQSFGAMLKQLPSKAEVANLLNDISQARVAASLEEELFQPQSEMPKDFYAAIPNKIIVLGSYHEMGSFVGAVAALPRIVTIEDAEVRSTGGKGKTAATQLRMTAQVMTYRYLDDSEIAASKPAAKGKGGKK
ncbi:type 4a pilus biogenesis protein PilO [Fontimonas sp. SYSU GA230001]|uniref:type 4a pilus biogenesis protein PilO n=1 Tax=Fontimonas sp. SYSU GA230001 TaxID=3142450 RepID=UPI0032B54410